MTTTLIITFCVLLLIAYAFDLSSSKTKIPAVILLLLLGWLVRQLTIWLEIEIPNTSNVLPVLGTIGLILIVLEGSLELELHKSKLELIGKSFFVALVPMAVLALLLALAFNHFGGYGIKDSLLNAIPFCVISSAIAIPSVKYLSNYNREFVIYESSLSDILGILIFNFLIFNENITAYSFGGFIIQIIIIGFISIFATIALSYLLSKIEHHIKFVPIILIVILIYAITKVYHLPGLIFILIFGLSIGNIDLFKRFKLIEIFNPRELKVEVIKFKELTTEGAFLIRSLFFLLFGFSIETKEVMNTNTLYWALGIVFFILAIRLIQLSASKLPLLPLLFIAPRGLITILLFISIEPLQVIPLVNNALIIQVIILSALVMMVGLMINKPKTSNKSNN